MAIGAIYSDFLLKLLVTSLLLGPSLLPVQRDFWLAVCTQCSVFFLSIPPFVCDCPALCTFSYYLSLFLFICSSIITDQKAVLYFGQLFSTVCDLHSSRTKIIFQLPKVFETTITSLSLFLPPHSLPVLVVFVCSCSPSHFMSSVLIFELLF